MANPKRRTSKARRDKRRSHHALTIPGFSRCSNCQEMKVPHRVCPACGHYKGKEILETDQDV